MKIKFVGSSRITSILVSASVILLSGVLFVPVLFLYPQLFPAGAILWGVLLSAVAGRIGGRFAGMSAGVLVPVSVVFRALIRDDQGIAVIADDIPLYLLPLAGGYVSGVVQKLSEKIRRHADEAAKIRNECEQSTRQLSRRVRELEGTKDFLEEIINRIADPVFVKDKDHRWVFMNDAHSDFMGYKTGDILGKSDRDIFPRYQADIFWEKDELVLHSGLENINEEEFTDSHGEVHVIQTKKTLYENLNGEKFIVGVFNDITERKRFEEKIQKLNAELEIKVMERTEELTKANARLSEDIRRRELAEKALEQEKERLSVTLKSIGDGVIAVDTAGKIILMNEAAEQLTGWSVAEAEGRDLLEVFVIVNGTTGKRCDNPVDIVLKTGGIAGLAENTVLVSRDGREMIISDSCAPIRDNEMRTIGVVLAFTDITEKKQLEEMLVNTQKLESIGILAGGIAHDFNNLLTGIFGFISLARDESPADSKIANLLSNSLTVWNRARDLTRQLLTFSKGGHPVKKITSITKMLKENAGFVLSGRNVNCTFDIPEDLWMCDIDINQISQAVDNITINAQQAMSGGGTIHIRAENLVLAGGAKIPLEKGRYIRISIADQGPGIPEKIRKKIFDPFFTTKSGGSGLGLATAYSIVKKHSGYIDVDSESGRGSTFNIYLPAAIEENTEKAEPSTLQPSHKVDGNWKILVMDDEQFILDFAGNLLTRLGCSVSLAHNGDEAVEIYRQAVANSSPFDLVILDLTIPGGISGKATLELLRGIDPNVRAVASSGYYDDPDIADPTGYGFIGTLSKPYSHLDLTQALQKYLRGGSKKALN